MIADWAVWIEASPAAEALRASFYVYPMINAAHLLGIALLIGTIVPVDLRLLGTFKQVPLAEFLPLMTGFAAAGLALAVISGLLLFMVQAQDYVDNPAFVAKVALVAIATANAVALRSTQGWRTARETGHIAPGLRVSALASLALWPAALLAGRWIGYL